MTLTFAPFQTLAAALLPYAVGPSGDGAHDLGHIIRVWHNAFRILSKETGNAEVLAAATLLHDCVAVEKSDPRRNQASRHAADRGATILAGLGWSGDAVTAVHHAISAHSFSANIPPETIEAKILQDADRLDAIGAIGVARCFYTAGRMASALYDPEDPSGNNRALDDRAFALDHFKAKLLTLSGGFQTATGAAMAKTRHDRLQGFLDDFLTEI